MASYVKKSLGDGETIIRSAGIAWPYHLKAWLFLLILGILIIGIFLFFRTYIWIWTTEFAITDRRLLMKEGWLSRATQELSLDTIEEVEVKQGFWGRLLGFGRLHLSGSGRAEICSPPINDPVGFQALLSDAREHQLHPATMPAIEPA
ncbi:MAG: PH domain-containing protein [Aquisalinus sp.]|nr:PH domain-containing protein [Aquisalinus sp.]